MSKHYKYRYRYDRFIEFFVSDYDSLPYLISLFSGQGLLFL